MPPTLNDPGPLVMGVAVECAVSAPDASAVVGIGAVVVAPDGRMHDRLFIHGLFERDTPLEPCIERAFWDAWPAFKERFIYQGTQSVVARQRDMILAFVAFHERWVTLAQQLGRRLIICSGRPVECAARLGEMMAAHAPAATCPVFELREEIGVDDGGPRIRPMPGDVVGTGDSYSVEGSDYGSDDGSTHPVVPIVPPDIAHDVAAFAQYLIRTSAVPCVQL